LPVSIRGYKIHNFDGRGEGEKEKGEKPKEKVKSKRKKAGGRQNAEGRRQ